MSATPDQGSCAELAGTVTCALGTVVSGASVDVVIVVAVPSDTAAGTITNNASASTTTPDPVAGNNATSEDTSITANADVSVAKVDSADPVTAGTGLSYTVSVSNAGPSDAAAVSLVDVLPSEVSYVSAAPDQGSCSESAGTVTCALGSIADGDTVDVVIVVAVPSDAAAGTITNNASVSSATTDPVAGNDAASEDTTVTTSADLSVVKVDSADPVVAGTGLSYTVTVANAGPSDAVAVSLVDVLPAEVSFVSATPDQGSCSEVAGTVTCALGTIATGASVDVVIAVTVLSDTSAGTITNNVSVSTSTTDPVGGNDATLEDTTITTSADLSVVKVDSADPVSAGAGFTYTVTVANGGPSDAATVSMVDVLPAGVLFVSAVPDQGSCAEVAGIVTCTLGTVASGAAIDIVISVTVPGGMAPGTITNNATVTTSTADPVAGNDAASEDTTIVTSADVSIAKVDSLDPVPAGTGYSYTVTVTNIGPSDATSVTVSDVLPAALTFVSAVPDQGSCIEAAGTVTCGLGTISSGGSVDVVIAVDVPADASPAIVTNNVSVSTASPDPNSANDSAAEGTTITAVADLSLSKIDSVDPVTAGTALPYTVTVTNSGPSDAASVVMVDTLPSGVTYVSAIPDQGTCAEAGGIVTCALGSVANGTSVDIVITVDVASDVVAGSSLVNTATVSSAAADPDISNNSDSESTVVDASADVSITKVDSVDPATAGAPLTYTLSVANAGPSDAVSTTVTDTLPAGLTYVSATPGQGTCSESAGTVTCALGSIADGDVVVISVVTSVDADVSDGSTIVNTASASSPTFDPTLGNNADAESTGIAALADLAITKSDAVDPVVAGTPLVYTIMVANNGASDAQSVTITDVLPANLSFVSAASSQGSCAEAAGTVTCALGTIVAGDAVSITLTTGVAESATGTIGNTASVASATTDPVAANNSDSETTTIKVEADLWVTKVSSPVPFVPGDPIIYTIVVGNDGPSSVTGAAVTDTLPAEVLAPTWTCVGAGGGVCTASGSGDLNETVDLPVGATVTFTITGTVDPATSVTAVITNTVTATVPVGATDPDPSDNSATDSNPFNPEADIALVKSATPDPVIAGTSLTYTLQVTNNGPATAIDVAVSDILPVGVSYSSAVVTGGAGSETCGEAAGVVSCSLGTIPDGATETVTIVVAVDASWLGSLANTASVMASSTDPVGANNDDSVVVVVTAQADLALTKTVAPTTADVGDALVYTIVVTTNGPSDATNVVVSDPIPTGILIDSATATQGACTIAGGLSCAIGTMEPGDSVTITVDATATASGTLVNTATVVSDTTDPDASDNSDSATVEVSGVGSIRSFVWWDVDKDGSVESGEPRIDGVTVDLYDVSGAFIATDVTDGAGAVEFIGLAPGAYELRIDGTTLPFGASLVSDPDGGGDGVAAVAVTLGNVTTGVDFGYAGTSTVEGVVFHDIDGDDTMEPPFEPGLPFVDVAVRWAGPDGIFATSDDVEFVVTTDGFGAYEAPCVPPGLYRMTVDEDSLPIGLEVTSPDHPATRNLGSGGTVVAAFGVGGNTAPNAVDDSVTTPQGVPVTIVILGNDTDPEGDSLAVTVVGSPSNGSVSLGADSSVTYTPDAEFSGVDTFVYTIVDTHGHTDTATVTITVTASNTPPDYVGPPSVPIEPGDPFPDPPVDDPDDDNVTIEIVDGDLPEGVDLIDNQFIGTPTEEGEFEVTFRVCDDGTPPLCTLTTVTYVIDELPFTGANSMVHLQWAITSIMLGTWLLIFASKRREDSEFQQS